MPRNNGVTLNVLGSTYRVVFQTPKDNPKLDEAEGLCEIYARKIIIDPTGAEDPMAFENRIEHYRRVLRHEAMHAFFAEAGLLEYTRDEALIDFLAVQFPKIRDLMDAADGIPIPGSEVHDV